MNHREGAGVLVVLSWALLGVSGDTEAVLDLAETLVQEGSAPMEPVVAKEEPAHPKHPGILKLGERQWRISESLRDDYSKDMEKLQSLARPRVHRSDAGEIDGYVLRIERYGLAHQAGLRNGDVVHAVNGHTLGAWPSVIAAYQALRREDVFRVRLTRRNGKRLTLVYQIH
jgi:type II secretory pathway component PulC